MQEVAFTRFNSMYGTFRLIWRKSGDPKILRIFLPNSITENVFTEKYDSASPDHHPAIDAISGEIIRFLNGEDIKFDFSAIDLSVCKEFQRNVLKVEYGIPRGWISTYGRIARILGRRNGARAVGHALSNNPFPIVIPCHRAILSNGKLGGFQGGVRMKMDLLRKEGIKFSSSGRVITDRIYY
jgi:methylated-DNA-[protein]-cysteine S-methyltransferase